MPVKKLKVQVKSPKAEKKGVKPTVKAVEPKVKKVSSVKAAPKTAEKVSASLQVELFDIKGKSTGTVSLPKAIFGATINNALMAQAVRVYLANQRQGTHSTKTRGEVHGSSRKIYKQKGTGRARHGNIRAPIFVKGGIVFGPKPQDYSLSLSKKMRRAALFSALSQKLTNKEIKIIVGLEKIDKNTKEMASLFTSLNVNKKKTLLVLPEHIEGVFKSARNIKDVSITRASQLNTYELLAHTSVLFMQPAIAVIEKTFLVSEEK